MFVFLRQAARLARKLDSPLKDFQDLAGVAYFDEFRQHDPTQKAVAKRMGISLRKAASMAASLRESFLRVDEDAGLPRRIEHMLWAKPASRARITQMISGDSEQISRAIAKLIAEGRVEEDTTARTHRLSITRGHARLVEDDWVSRLDGVENLLHNVSDTVEDRFFEDEKASTSMARTVSVGIRSADLPKLRQLYEEQVWPFLIALEESSRGEEDVVEINLSMIWAKNREQERENEKESE